MLPLHQAIEARESILLYQKTTANFCDYNVKRAYERFISDAANGLCKGPYISLRTPYLVANQNEYDAIPLDIKPKFYPYKHQIDCFFRLSTFKSTLLSDVDKRERQEPKPTILTTGTGSGKTESFLFPILDYCYQQSRNGVKGIKVIIMYPMNALATDQAARLAEAIHSDERLRGKVTAGLFIGTGIHKKWYQMKNRNFKRFK